LAGVDVNARAKDLLTPLFMAAMNGQLRCCRLLLEAGADPNIANNGGVSPLMMASQQGHIQVVDLLLKSGADVHAVNKKRATALHYTCIDGHVGIILQLLKVGAVVDARAVYGDTPLALAVYHNQKMAADLLLRFGADKSLLHPAYRFKLEEMLAPECETCGAKRGSDLYICVGCREVRYCDATCQAKHWKKHKKVCKLPRCASKACRKRLGDIARACIDCQTAMYCSEACLRSDKDTHGCVPVCRMDNCGVTENLRPCGICDFAGLFCSKMHAAAYPHGCKLLLTQGQQCENPACDKIDDLKICMRCRNVRYCSRECQRADWEQHSRECEHWHACCGGTEPDDWYEHVMRCGNF